MIRIFLELTKFRIAAFSTLSAATGFVVFSRSLRWGILSSCLGTLLLALGACALNEWQDRELDARMERTRRRPIPSGRLAPTTALATACALVLVGACLLWTVHGATSAILGLFAVGWYNGVYTYLKRASAFAVVPGSIIGALPPAIGWTAAGGEAGDPHVLALCFFFFVWQVPHFWLLLFIIGTEYEKVGLPSLTAILGRAQLGRLTFVWMVGTAASSLLLRLFGLIASPQLSLALAGAGIWLVWRASRLLRGGDDRSTFGRAFGGINLYALLVMSLLVVDALALN